MNFQEVEIVDPEVDGKVKSNRIPELVRTQHITPQQKEELLKLLSLYSCIFKTEKDKLSATGLLEHQIKTKSDQPIYSRNYRYPQHFREQIREEINKMLENKIITPSNSPYNSPVWVVILVY